MSTSAIQVVVIKDQSTVVQVVDVQANASLQRQALSIQAQKGFRYQLKDMSSPKQGAPEKVQLKRVGKDLHLVFQEKADLADVILECCFILKTEPL